MAKKYINPIMTVAESDAMSGKFISDADIKTVYKEDIDLYDKESGKCIAILRKGVIPGEVQAQTFKALLKAANPSLTRGTASGEPGTFNVRASGKRSKTSEAPPVDSGIVGYFDRKARTPYCRMTAFTARNFAKFKMAYPMVSLVNAYYRLLMPREFNRQLTMCAKTSPDFVIPSTVFTTITVNKNYRTAVHKDSGDFKGGFGNLVAMRKGYFEGGILCLVRWGVGFDLQNGDLLLMDVHQWHANTPLKLIDPKATRLSLVMYYRENMVKCGSAKEELLRVKNRKAGDKL